MPTPLLASPLSNSPASDSDFDYEELPGSLRRMVREQTEAIQGLLADAANHVVQIGLRLQFVRDRLGRRSFQPWLRTEFAWSQSVASNYMRAARAFGELDCLAQFQPSALFILARKKCPPAARAEAILRAQRGDRITKVLAQEIVDRFSENQAQGRKAPDQVRRYLHKTLRKLSPDQVKQLAHELLEMAEQMANSIDLDGDR